jgi:glycosyltransferase involved in cell wall biosynthesis
LSAPFVSIIIPTHNRPEKIAATVACLRQQTLSAADYEIIVVDDGSTPRVVLTSHSDGPTCRLVRLEGLERSAARNAGARSAQGDLLVFVDDDLLIPADFLKAHVRASEQWRGALQVGEIRLPADALTTPFGRFRQGLEDGGKPPAAGPSSLLNFCAAGNMAIPRDRFEELQGFDLNIVSGEDQDFALRHTAGNGIIVFVPHASVIHQDSALDIRTYCRRAAWGAELMIPFCHRYPERAENVVRAQINGPTRWGQEPILCSCRKLLKSMLASQAVIWLLFRLSSSLERWAPNSNALDRVYRLLLGAHIFRGYRNGLKRYRNVDLQRAPCPRPTEVLGQSRCTIV